MKFDGAVIYTFAPLRLQRDFWDATGGPFQHCNMTHLVELYESEGLMGTMICTEKMARVILPHILTGESKTVGEWLDLVYWKNRNNGFNGESAYEFGRFEFLLYDILAKRENQPLHRYLGAEKDCISAYGSGAGTNLSDSEMVKEIEGFLRDGYRSVKMKVAAHFGSNLNRDIQRIALVRKTIGDDIGLAIDANQYFNSKEALEFIGRADQYKIEWYEEPIHSSDFEGLRELTKLCPVDIAMGESMRNHFMFKEYINCGVKHLQPCPSNMAGITEWMKIRDMAEEKHITITSGGLPYMASPLIATAGSDARQEYLAPVEDMQREFLSVKWEIKNGTFILPDIAGVPFVVDINYMQKKGLILRKDYYYPN